MVPHGVQRFSVPLQRGFVRLRRSLTYMAGLLHPFMVFDALRRVYSRREASSASAWQATECSGPTVVRPLVATATAKATKIPLNSLHVLS